MLRMGRSKPSREILTSEIRFGKIAPGRGRAGRSDPETDRSRLKRERQPLKGLPFPFHGRGWGKVRPKQLPKEWSREQSDRPFKTGQEAKQGRNQASGPENGATVRSNYERGLVGRFCRFTVSVGDAASAAPSAGRASRISVPSEDLPTAESAAPDTPAREAETESAAGVSACRTTGASPAAAPEPIDRPSVAAVSAGCVGTGTGSVSAAESETSGSPKCSIET